MKKVLRNALRGILNALLCADVFLLAGVLMALCHAWVHHETMTGWMAWFYLGFPAVNAAAVLAKGIYEAVKYFSGQRFGLLTPDDICLILKGESR